MPNNQGTNDERYLLYIEHGNQYTDLLRFYIKNVRISNILKIIFKISFFVIIIWVMFILSIFFGYSIYKSFKIIGNLNITKYNSIKSIESIVGIIGTLIPSFTTLLVSIIKLPEIIAKYLFNRKEEEHMAKIIENIQNYDVQIYSIEKEAKAFVKKQQNGINSGEVPNRDLQVGIQTPSDDNDTSNNATDNNT